LIVGAAELHRRLRRLKHRRASQACSHDPVVLVRYRAPDEDDAAFAERCGLSEEGLPPCEICHLPKKVVRIVVRYD